MIFYNLLVKSIALCFSDVSNILGKYRSWRNASR